MKLFKKVSAVLLALAMIAVMVPQVGNKVVKAADGTVTWLAADTIKQNNLVKASAKSVTGTLESLKETYNEEIQQQEADKLKYEQGGLIVAPLPQPLKQKDASNVTKNVWGTNGDSAYLTGTDNARPTPTGSAVTDAKVAPTVGTALKINVTSKGTITAVVQGGGTTAVASLKNIYVTSFTSGQTADGEVVWKTLMNFDSAKKDVTCEFSAEPGKDYYLFVTGSKGSFKSVTYTPTEESKVCATVDCLKTLGAAYREPTEGYSNGIRFGSILDATTVKKLVNDAVADIDVFNDVETGTLVALESTMNENNITELTLDADKNSVVGLKVQRTTFLDNKNQTLSYSVAIVNIPEERQGIKFVARPYIINSDGTVYYGDQISASWDEIKAKATALQ